MGLALAEALSEPAVMAVNGAELLPDRSGGLYWPGERLLVVSDLHLEKGSAYAARGVHLPPYDTRATLAALDDLIGRYRPDTVVALGDSFHDRACEARMSAGDRDHLRDIVGRARWVWIAGNHDPSPPAHLGGEVCEELRVGPLRFRHEPEEGAAAGEVAGHLHPCARISRRGRSVRRRCFVTDGARLIAPAFGAFAGGLNVRDAAFAPLLEPRAMIA
ncbi:MAG: ligase-associated DNA damage response endonuclease PdeM, partial [Caulobacterales bacterium]|nr:ligase-associated DNA damage response endonuclease PdeM [Caulobacterales bacterium]